MRLATILGLLLIASSACQSSTGNEGDSPRAFGLLCPDCPPSVGGDTSDFGSGSPPTCDYRDGPLLVHEERLEHAQALKAVEAFQTFQTDLSWQADAQDDAREVPASSDLHVSAELGEPGYLEEVRRYIDRPCDQRYIRIPVTLTLSASDQSIQAELHGSLLNRLGSSVWNGSAVVDLSEVSGTLDLTLEGQHPRGGYLFVTYQVESDGRVSGKIAPHAYYTDEPRRDSEGGLATFAPVTGQFPAE